MLKGKSYDNRIDTWALGILLYEMVHGDAPYGEDTPIPDKMEFIKRDKEFEYDSTLSIDLLDLIKSILVPNPNERITLTEIFNHPWMKKFEQNYGIDIDSFVTQNSRDAKSTKSERISLDGDSQSCLLYTSPSPRDRG